MERRKEGSNIRRQVNDYVLLTLGTILGVVGWNIFLLPNQIPMGGITGIASIIFWGTGIPAQHAFFALNAVLLIAALRVLGWKFCVKTIYAVVTFTIGSSIVQYLIGDTVLLADQKFMATIVGGVFLGASVGLGLAAGGSTGGTDVIAAMIHKYRDVFFVLNDWEKVLYGYVLLFVLTFFVDHVVNSMRQSVQFIIVSDKYEQIGEGINHIVQRGCSLIEGQGFYSRKEIKMVFCIAKKSESALIFSLIDEIDPEAFVSQSAVIGAYGQGFDAFKVNKKILRKQIKQAK